MNKFKIIVSSEFGMNKDKIYKITELTLKKLVKVIEVEDFQITIDPFSSDNQYWKISGATDDPHKIWLELNVAYSNFEELKNIYLPKAIVHEFHHLARKEFINDWNLLELLVMEGLALHFEMEMLNTEKSPLTRDITDEEIQNVKSEIISDLYNEDFDHKFWQNKTEREAPQAFVYRFGYRIVNEYLMKHSDKNSIVLCKETAMSFLPEYLKVTQSA